MKRLLRKNGVIDFVQWLNEKEPVESGWDKAEFISVMRSPDLEALLARLRLLLMGEALLSAEDQGNRQDLRRLTLFCLGVPELIFDLPKIRECACGCGTWFLAERRNQKHYGGHRRKAWEQRATPDRKERRRVQNRDAQKRFYDRTFKAPPSA